MSDFHERFNIKVGMDEARQRFISRAYNEIFDKWDNFHYTYRKDVIPSILSYLGKRYRDNYYSIADYTQNKNFKDVLYTIESIYKIDTIFRNVITTKVKEILALSEIDLGIRWQDGKFLPKGAELLDDKLVNDPLKWLGDKEYKTVIEPYKKALDYFLHSESRPELLSDVIGNSYKALEALAKIVVGNNSDLSTNKKPFVKRLNGNNFHEQIFKVLEKYLYAGNPYRHGENLEKPLPELTYAETEFFLYLTGTFIRLAMENQEDS